MIKFSLFLLTLAASAKSFKVVHYNIKELDSTKVIGAKLGKNEQVKQALEVIKELGPDILSINELQYDYPGVPTNNFHTTGSNLKVLGELLNINFNTSFNPANTGLNSKPNEHGVYILKPTQEERLKYADQINFGLFPAQYSVGALFKFKKVKEVVISDLKWTDFNTNRDPSIYSDGAGNPLPKDIQLFDKNFTDVTLEIYGRKVHLILLHTVPAFNFGNDNSPNYVRNLDQLEFLKWYLSGKTKVKMGEVNIKPLAKNSTFIAMGDWNVDPKSTNPGASVITELGEKFNYWIKEHTITYRGSSFAPNGWQSQLDYILLSKDLKTLKSGVFNPAENRVELGCDKPFSKNLNDKQVLVEYSKNKKTCQVLVSKDAWRARTASDHLAIWAEIEFR